METVKPYKMIFQLGKNEITEARTIKRFSYHHYTNLDSLKEIMKTKTLLLNRIDSVNDLLEKEYLEKPEVYSLVYISCFTHKEIESIPHWFIYTKKNKGVRITFESDEKFILNSIIDYSLPIQVIGTDNSQTEYFNKGSFFYNSESKWSIEIQSSDIVYDSKLMRDNPIINYFNGEKHIDLTPLAKLKTEEWDYELESRMIGTFRTTYENINFKVPKHILIPLKFDNTKLRITMNPWADYELEEEIRKIFYELDFEVEYSIDKSMLHGKIVKK